MWLWWNKNHDKSISKVTRECKLLKMELMIRQELLTGSQYQKWVDKNLSSWKPRFHFRLVWWRIMVSANRFWNLRDIPEYWKADCRLHFLFIAFRSIKHVEQMMIHVKEYLFDGCHRWDNTQEYKVYFSGTSGFWAIVFPTAVFWI